MLTEAPPKRRGRPKRVLPSTVETLMEPTAVVTNTVQGTFVKYHPNPRLGMAIVDGEPRTFFVSGYRLPNRKKLKSREVINLTVDDTLHGLTMV